MPVLTFRCTSRLGYDAIRFALGTECAVTWRRLALASASPSESRSVKTRIGAFIPACRSSAPSSAVTTAKESAPASRAARAVGTAPWPYALAFTTAMSRAPPARRLRVRTLCRMAPRSTSAQVRLGTVGGACTTKCWLEARFEDVEGKNVHAGYDTQQALVLDDGQDLLALLGHDGGALQGLPAVLLPIPKRDDATQDIQKARRFDLRILEDQISLRDYPDQTIAFHNWSARDAGLGEEPDGILHRALRSQGRPVGLQNFPDFKLPDVLLLHAL